MCVVPAPLWTAGYSKHLVVRWADEPGQPLESLPPVSERTRYAAPGLEGTLGRDGAASGLARSHCEAVFPPAEWRASCALVLGSGGWCRAMIAWKEGLTL